MDINMESIKVTYEAYINIKPKAQELEYIPHFQKAINHVESENVDSKQ